MVVVGALEKGAGSGGGWRRDRKRGGQARGRRRSCLRFGVVTEGEERGPGVYSQSAVGSFLEPGIVDAGGIESVKG